MQQGDQQDSPHCYFHPKEKIIGVCAPCLKERLLVLASKQRHHQHGSRTRILNRFPSTTSFLKVFALGSLFQRLDIRQKKTDFSGHASDTSTSHEDPFISIKFEDNGRASWDKRSSWTSSDVFELPSMQCPNKDMMNLKNASVVEHAKSRPAALRWRSRIGHLLQLVRWTRSDITEVGTKADGVKGKRSKGWIRAITKRKTTRTAFPKA